MLCLLSALSLCPRCVACEYGSISRFWGVFRGFYGVCVGLFVLRAFCGLCGFCARVELGGLKACGVFAPIFIFFVCVFAFILSVFLSLSLFLSFVLVSLCLMCFACSLVLSCLFLCLCVFFFPCGLKDKKKGRKFFASSLVLLWVCYIFSASLSVASFAFENIHPAPQERCLLNLPPRVLRVSLIAFVSPTIAIAFSE